MAEQDGSIPRREAIVEQREIDAEVRASRTRLIAEEQRAEDGSLLERDILTDLREQHADERELQLDERESELTERAHEADLRRRDLDEEGLRQDERAQTADQREIDEAQRY